MTINVCLFGHILLDPELQGRFGVQGNTFKNTTTYFHEYIDSIDAQKNLSEENKARLLALTKATKQLVDAEKALEQFQERNYEFENGEDILIWTKTLIPNILNLKSGLEEQVLFPGGWRNPHGGGHAMIYQFTKNTDGDLVFSIYNSGAGLNLHAKDSTFREDRYFPVKTYVIPQPIDENELNQLLYQLTLAQTPRHYARRNNSKLDADKLYLSIAKNMDYLDATLLNQPAPHHYTTTGQISGTCAQRSIHQMVKANFDTLEHYQQFILKFKMHALREFINTHPHPHPKITELILLAIENNLKILQKLEVFDDSIYEELRGMKSKILQNKPTPVYAPLPTVEKPIAPFSLNAQPLTVFEPAETQPLSPLKTLQTLYTPLKSSTLIEQLNTLSEACEKNEDAQWIMQQIERVMVQLPLPSDEKTFNNPSQGLEGLDSAQFEEITKLLTHLQKRYIQVCHQCLGKNILPVTLVTQLSFLTAYNYIQYAVLDTNPTLHTYMSSKLSYLLNIFQHNPAMISVHPDVDKRLKQLWQIYPTSRSYVDEKTLYITLIEQNPALHQLVNDHYQNEVSLRLSENERHALKREHAEALYTLLKYHNEDGTFSLPPSLDDVLFKPLIQSIQTALRFEHYFKESAVYLEPNQKKSFNTLKIKFKSEYRYTSLEWQSPANISINYIPSIQAPENLPLHRAQLTESSLLKREFYHLRASPQFQAHFTLDYFKKNKSALFNKKNQRYLVANILEPNRILDALKQPSFLTDLDELIQEGLNSRDFIEPDGTIKQEGLFLLRLNLLVNRYLLEETSVDKKVIQNRLAEDYARINGQIATTSNTDILSSLHRYRLMCLCVQEDLLQDPRYFEQALASYFYIRAYANREDLESIDEKFDRQQLEYTFKLHLQQYAAAGEIQSILTPMVEALLNQDLAKFNISGTYPVYTLSQDTTALTYTLHVEEGKIYSDNNALAPIPAHFLNHPFLAQLNLTDRTTCLQSPDGLIIEFPPDVRIKQNNKNEIIAIQKKWNINQQEAWYELQPTLMHKYYQLDARPLIAPQLPKIINDKDTEFWIKEGMVGSFIIQKGEPCYVLNEQLEFEQLNESGQKNGNVLQHQSDIYTKITPFESSDFILAHAHLHSGTIECPRYHLSLLIDADQNIYLKDNVHQKLVANDFPFQSNIARLTFSDGKNTQCIIPVQQFYVDSKEQPEEGHHFRFIHDISNHIESDRHESGYPWQYTNSCKTISYSIENGEPKPRNTAEALYLCYLYLAQQDQDKAWKVLEDVQKFFSLTGSVEEQIYLSWILYALPGGYGQAVQDATLESPRDISCQLKALALYTTFLAEGHAPQAIPYGHSQQTLAKRLNIELPTKITTLYNKWLNITEHLSESYTLSQDERKSLLSASAFTPTGAIGYSSQELKLQTLFTLKKRLEGILAATPDLPHFYKKQLLQLEEKIQAIGNVAKQTTILERTFIPLKLSTHPIEDTQLTPYYGRSLLSKKLPSFNKDTINFEHLILQKDFPQLNSSLTSYAIITHFPTLLQIASAGRFTDHSYLSQLNKLCIRYLRHEARKALDPQYKPTVEACLINILYRVLTHPECVNQLNMPEPTLSDLIQIIQTVEVPAIELSYEKDVYTETLAITQQIIHELETKSLSQAPILLQPLHQLPLREQIAEYIVDEAAQKVLTEGYVEMLNATRTYDEAIEDLDPNDIEIELKAGALQYQLTQSQCKIAEQTLASTDTRKQILTAAVSYNNKIHSKLKEKWENILKHANKALQEVQITARQRHVLTREDLLQCYLQCDYAKTIELTNLPKEDCKKLHDLMHECISDEILAQQSSRLIDELNQLEPNSDAMQLSKVAQLLLNETDVSIENDPALMLFQYLNTDNEGKAGILLRKRQVEALSNLLKTKNTQDVTQFNESIEKVIMGGGKSKVLLPLLAQKKATGTNLVIIEVPRALLKTNYNDLKQTSQLIFNQKAFLFEFNRDSDCSPQRLEQIFTQFTDMMANKSYLVTTGESIQALELKYLDLLLSPPKDEHDRKIWNKQVYWASQITTLLKQSGDVIIDEIHEGALLKKKLNFTRGESKPVPEQWIQLTTQFYRFLEQYKPVNLIEELITNQFSPLKPYLEELCQKNDPALIHEAIENYLNNKQEPDFFSTIDADLRGVLAFYKEQLRLYPQTTDHQYKVHYGPSKESNKTSLERVLAIPYSANEKPNEQSRFGNPFETINYTVQSLLHQGLNEELLIHTIKQWQSSARFEFQINANQYSKLDETPSAKTIIQRYLAETDVKSLQNIDVKNEKQIKQLLEQLRHHPDLILHILEKSILKQITIEPAILHSDAYNHVDMYHSVQGVSGTPSNYTTYHQRFNYNKATSLGTDGYIEKIIQEKKTPIHAASLTNLKDFLANILDKNTNIRAVIDISATFAGISNLDIAKALVEYYAEKPQIQYILYFNDQDVLCAWNIKSQKNQILGTSDPHEINRLLNCKPQDRVTYYDQAHTVGTDLKQATSSCGVCLVNEKTHIQAFLQGCMRMRGLEEKQHIEIVVPEHLGDQTLDTLLHLMRNNENTQLREDNFYAAMGMMHNWFRNQALITIQSLPDHDTEGKALYATALEHFFVDIQSIDLEQYSAIYQEIDTEVLLHEFKTKLIHNWTQCLSKINPPPPISIEPEIELHQIIKTALPYCNKRSLSPQHSNRGTEVQVQTEQLTKKEVQQLTQQQTEHTKLKALRYFTWNQTNLNQFNDTGSVQHPRVPNINEWEAPQSEINSSTTLNEHCKTAQIFSPQLQVSANYAYVYQGQTDMLSTYLEPVHAVLFRLHDNQLSAIILDTQEINDISKLLDEDPSLHEKIWLSSTKPMCLSGVAPKDIEQHPDYHRLLEQIYFFNGECQTLVQQTKPATWLSEQTQEKFDFFKSSILPYRETKPDDLARLYSIYFNPPIGLEYINTHAFSDLSKVAWQKRYPTAFPLEIAECQVLSKAYLAANQSVQTTELNFNDAALQGCSSQAKEQFKHHLDSLRAIKVLLKKITVDSSVLHLSQEEQFLLSSFLSLNIQLLINKYPKDAELQQQVNIDVLMSLIQSPFITDKHPFETLLINNPFLKTDVKELLKLPLSEHALLALAIYIYPHDINIAKQTKGPLHQELAEALYKNKTLSNEVLLQWMQLPNVTPTFLLTLLKNNLIFSPESIAKINETIQTFSAQDKAIVTATLFTQTHQLKQLIQMSEFETLIQNAETDALAKETLERVFTALEQEPELLIQVPLTKLGPHAYHQFLTHTRTFSHTEWQALMHARSSHNDLCELLKVAPVLPQETLTSCLNKANDDQNMQLILQRKEADDQWLQAHHQTFLSKGGPSVIKLLTERVFNSSYPAFIEAFVPELLSCRKITEPLIAWLLTHPNLPPHLFVSVMKQVKHESTLRMLIDREDIAEILQNETRILNMLQHPLWTPQHLADLFKNPKTPAIFYHTLLHQAPSLLVSTEILSTFLEKVTLTDDEIQHLIDVIHKPALLRCCLKIKLKPQHLLALSQKTTEQEKEAILRYALPLFNEDINDAIVFFTTFFKDTKHNELSDYIRNLPLSMGLCLAITDLPQTKSNHLILLIEKSTEIHTEQLYKAILQHPHADATLLSRLNPALISTLQENIVQLWDGRNLPALQTIFNQDSVPITWFTSLIPKANHGSFNAILEEAIKRHVLFEPSFLALWVDHQQLTDEKLIELINIPEAPSSFLHKIVMKKEFLYHGLFIAILQHPHLNEAIYLDLMKHLSDSHAFEEFNQHPFNVTAKKHILQKSPEVDSIDWKLKFIDTLDNDELALFLKINSWNYKYHELIKRENLNVNVLIVLAEKYQYDRKPIFDYANRIQHETYDETLDRILIPKLYSSDLEPYLLSDTPIPFARLQLILQLNRSCLGYQNVPKLVEKICKNTYPQQEKFNLLQLIIKQHNYRDYSHELVQEVFTSAQDPTATSAMDLLNAMLPNMSVKQIKLYLPLIQKPIHDELYSSFLLKLKKEYSRWDVDVPSCSDFLAFMMQAASTPQQEQSLYETDMIVTILRNNPTNDVINTLLSHVASAEELIKIVEKKSLTLELVQAILAHPCCTHQVLVTCIQQSQDKNERELLFNELNNRSESLDESTRIALFEPLILQAKNIVEVFIITTNAHAEDFKELIFQKIKNSFNPHHLMNVKPSLFNDPDFIGFLFEYCPEQTSTKNELTDKMLDEIHLLMLLPHPKLTPAFYELIKDKIEKDSSCNTPAIQKALTQAQERLSQSLAEKTTSIKEQLSQITKQDHNTDPNDLKLK